MARISVLVNNYNYGPYLKACLDSVLKQTEPPLEFIVVDDGSTDDSRVILKAYQDRAHIILQDNGGQAAAMNTGFQASSGDWVLFLDADDMLLPNALQVLEGELQTSFAKLHYPLLICDGHGGVFDQLPKSKSPLKGGNALALLKQDGALQTMPTSGNVFARSYLQSIMPIPENSFRICADAYLFYGNLADQEIAVLEQPLAQYRVHGKNWYHRQSQFSGDAAAMRRKVTAMAQMLSLFQQQQLLDAKAEGSEYLLRFADLEALKFSIALQRMGEPLPESFNLSLQRLVALAEKRIATLPSDQERLERVALMIFTSAPLTAFPFFAWLERSMKRAKWMLRSQNKVTHR